MKAETFIEIRAKLRLISMKTVARIVSELLSHLRAQLSYMCSATMCCGGVEGKEGDSRAGEKQMQRR